SCTFVVKFYRDSITETAGACIARNVDCLRGHLCRVSRHFAFSQSRARPGPERITCPIDFYDNSIIQRASFDQARSARIEKETDARTISSYSAMRDRAAVSERVLGQSSARHLCRCCQRRTTLHVAR